MTYFDSWESTPDFAANNPSLRPADLPTNRPAEQEASHSGVNRRSPLVRFLPTFTAAALVAFTFVMRPIDFARALFGEFSFEVLDGEFCSDCRDVHAGACPRSMTGDCDICGTVKLDRFLNCSLAGNRWRFHGVANRRVTETANPNERGDAMRR